MSSIDISKKYPKESIIVAFLIVRGNVPRCARNNYTKKIGHLQTNMKRSVTYLDLKPASSKGRSSS
jgi:hypothetical protein